MVSLPAVTSAVLDLQRSVSKRTKSRWSVPSIHTLQGALLPFVTSQRHPFQHDFMESGAPRGSTGRAALVSVQFFWRLSSSSENNRHSRFKVLFYRENTRQKVANLYVWQSENNPPVILTPRWARRSVPVSSRGELFSTFVLSSSRRRGVSHLSGGNANGGQRKQRRGFLLFQPHTPKNHTLGPLLSGQRAHQERPRTQTHTQRQTDRHWCVMV